MACLSHLGWADYAHGRREISRDFISVYRNFQCCCTKVHIEVDILKLHLDNENSQENDFLSPVVL